MARNTPLATVADPSHQARTGQGLGAYKRFDRPTARHQDTGRARNTRTRLGLGPNLILRTGHNKNVEVFGGGPCGGGGVAAPPVAGCGELSHTGQLD